jgi:excinuclease ABC subunit C
MAFDNAQLDNYPKLPGVYIIKDVNANVIYVGKAKNLRSRLKQYFIPKRDSRAMINFLVPKINSINTIVVSTEKEALILENTLIKRHKPKYNILLKDDKTYVSLMLTHHQWPMLRLIRIHSIPPKDKNHYFGPYTNAKAARQTLDLISRLFPLRQCSDRELTNRSRPCLLYDINRCIAPCINKCNKNQYEEHVNRAIKLLKGQDKEILKELKTQMTKASDNLEFEKAKDILEMINQIEHVTQIQHVENRSAQFCDAIGLYKEGDTVVIALLIFRKGKLIGSQHFTFSNISSFDEEIIEGFLLQYYKIKDALPEEILLPTSLENKDLLEEILSDISKKKIHLLSPQKGKKKDLIYIANKNAKAIFSQEHNSQLIREKLLLELQERLELTNFPRHIECIDISNLSGKESVGCIIGFINAKKDKNKTKLFKSKIEEVGDCQVIKHVLLRHFTREKQKGSFCDLLIIDGAKAQLNAALSALKELDIALIDVVAITKEKAKHTKGLTQERLFIPNKKEAISLPIRSPILFFLQKIRDEAHRVAITFQKKRRKKTISSSLEDIEGIGPKKRKALLKHFHSLERIKKASKEDLKKLKILSQKDVDNLLKF